MDARVKKFLVNYGFFLALIFTMALVVTPLIILNRSFVIHSYSLNIQKTLDEKFPDEYRVGNNIKINSPFSVNGAVFELNNAKNRKLEKTYVIIIRINTIYGPKPAIFIHKDGQDSTFVGYGLDQGKVSSSISSTDNDINIIYWKSKIPEIIKKLDRNKITKTGGLS